MTPEALGRVARRFPLVARARPPCRTLDERIQEVVELASAAAGTMSLDRLAMAAAAQNKAALIASDCGMPDFAAALCWRQAELYLRCRPLTARAARYALEPLVNLTRLRLRAGAAESAYGQIEELHRAVRTEGSVTVGGREAQLDSLTMSAGEHDDLCRWLWGVMLADGVRALAAANQWSQAAAFAHRYRGVGRRLLDGRQATIIACALTGEPESALAIVEQCAASKAWEQAVAACLSAFCRRAAGHPPCDAELAGITEYLDLEPEPELATFRARLALTAIDLSGGVRNGGGGSISRRLVEEALAVEDGNVARDLLGHLALREKLTKTQESHLASVVRSAFLGRCSIPESLHTELLVAVEKSASITVELLRDAQVSSASGQTLSA